MRGTTRRIIASAAAVAAVAITAAGCAASDGRADSAAAATYDSVRAARPAESLPPAAVVPPGATSDASSGSATLPTTPRPSTGATPGDTVRRGPRPPTRPPGGYIYIDTSATRESLRLAKPTPRPPR